jgi:hypothetical protein
LGLARRVQLDLHSLSAGRRTSPAGIMDAERDNWPIESVAEADRFHEVYSRRISLVSADKDSKAGIAGSMTNAHPIRTLRGL